MTDGSPGPVAATPRLVHGVLMALAGLVAVSSLGAWPTWRFCGKAGLVAAAWAVAVNVVVFSISLAGVYWVARRKGLLAAGKTFMYTGVPRIALMVAVGFLAAGVAGVGGAVFWLWTGGVYVALVMIEATWLARSLAGRTGRPKTEEKHA